MYKPTNISRPQHWSRLLTVFVVACAIATVALIAAVVLRHGDGEATIVHRDDPVADLLGWIPATDETRASFAVWTPDGGADATGTVVPTSEMHGEKLALEPMPTLFGYSTGLADALGFSAWQITSWVAAGPSGELVVLSGDFDQNGIVAHFGAGSGFDRSDYRGARIFSFDDSARAANAAATILLADRVIALLGDKIIIANSVDEAKAVVNTVAGKQPSLADDDAIASLLRTVAPANALMVVDAMKHASDCAGDESTATGNNGRFVAVAYGRLGEGGDRRTLAATSFGSTEEATLAEAAFELGWQNGYVVSGSSGAPISTFGQVSNVSQSGALLIAELVDGREDGWTRAAIRLATPVCDAVREQLPADMANAQSASGTDGLAEALGSLPDPGTEGATLFADVTLAQANAGVSAPEEDATAGDVETWLAKLGPLPTFDAFPSDGTKLVRWQELFGIPLHTIRVIAETHGLQGGDTAAVLVGEWDSGTVGDALTNAGYRRVDYGEATIFAVSGDVSDPSHPTNRAGGAAWYNVAVIDNRIFLSPSSRRLREIVDYASGGQSDPPTANGMAISARLLTGQTGITMGEIVGRDFQTQSCVDSGVTGISPDWQGAAAFWNSTPTGGSGGIVFIPVMELPLETIQEEIDQQIQESHVPGEASSDQATGSFSELFGYQGVHQGNLEDGTIALLALFDASDGPTQAGFFAMSVEGCRFGSA